MAQISSGPFYYDSSNPRSFIGVIVSLCLLVLCWILVFCRFLARLQIKSTGQDDWFIIPSTAFFSAFVVSGFKLHEIVPGNIPSSIAKAASSMTWLVVSEVTYSQSILFLKLSLGFFFLRLVVSRTHRFVIYGVMILSTITNLFVSFWDIGICGNPALYWHNLALGKCVSKDAQIFFAYAQASVNASTDLTLSAIPFFLLRGTKMKGRVRVYVTFMLVLATAGCIVSITRFFYVHYLWGGEGFYATVPTLGLISTIEIAAGIIASSLATLRPLLSTLIPSDKDTIRVAADRANIMGTGTVPGGPNSRNRTYRQLASPRHHEALEKALMYDNEEHGHGITHSATNSPRVLHGKDGDVGLGLGRELGFGSGRGLGIWTDVETASTHEEAREESPAELDSPGSPDSIAKPARTLAPGRIMSWEDALLENAT